MELKELENKLGLEFKDKTLLKTALTHRSYLNENTDYPNPSNERLEFLGDAVLQFLSSEFLYNNYPNREEGILTAYRAALVNTKSLAEESKRLGFGKYLLLSRGEEKSNGRENTYILANTFEAILGAIYLEINENKCREFLKKNLFYKINDIIEEGKHRDSKSLFQEKAQELHGITPNYKLLEDWGPDHNKKFEVGVYLKDKLIAKGKGKSKQKAETQAAKKGLVKFEKDS